MKKPSGQGDPISGHYVPRKSNIGSRIDDEKCAFGFGLGWRMEKSSWSDVPNTAAYFDDIREGFTPIANIDTSSPRHFSFQDTTGNQHIPEHDEIEPPFNYNREQVPNRYDEQFAHVQRLVPPPYTFYSINSDEVAPIHVTMRLEVGELFPSKKQLQSQVGSYALANRFQIRVFKSDTIRYQVRCIVEDCNWRLREHILEEFRDHRLYKPKQIMHDMQREFGISCNYHKGYRARHIALEEVQGTPVKSYSILPSYMYMLEQANLGTVTDLHTYSSNRFIYMFFCLKACIDSFLSSIRPVIAIDVTFLKGPHRWVLFVAVCMDGNDQIFPLAFGVGDLETNEAWEWFLTRLHKAVGEVDDLVIVSDKKGSITTGVEKVFPNSFHGACAVHLERNMVGHYGRNKTLKQYFRRPARVYQESQFLHRMEQLSNVFDHLSYS
ncbi:hypothetical protein Dsin_014767 [Dipteronia sinensis]|uniref:MULE transposase domain-containing protein n=1 Tax=Dipteronia sinensis TaxID=43782 RepID=A0AAE0ANS9_9ROSI|nr:hypothetical protein Dsin_014767 [Dipteronia sinensis]